MNILVIDDNQTMREGIAQIIKNMGHHVFEAENGNEGLEISKNNIVDFTICDLKMEEMDGIGVLKEIKKVDPEALFMIITGYGTIEVAVEAMRIGAYDFITKPFSADVLKAKVENALKVKELSNQNVKLQRENLILKEDNMESFSSSTIIGKSACLKEVIERIEKIALTDSSVLITGESGTGKELVAKAIHYASKRKDKPFIKVNCGALAEGVLESELFGHEKGSFTGAIKRKLGRFELADTGTIFLDEVGDFSPTLQLKLLRVLQEREFERVGGTETLKVDVRFISATNKNLEECIIQGSFREDLYYRLHIIPVVMPNLRDRKEDIPILLEHFVNKLNKKTGAGKKRFSSEALAKLSSYYWPGNIRELENITEQIYVLSSNDIIEENDLPVYILSTQIKSNLDLSSQDLSLNDALEKLEKRMIEEAYKKASGIKTEAARLLGIKTSALYYKLEKYGLIEVTEKK
ncbi:MAG: sigma-54 dependent transcriptional regulator [Pseudomonadota bacterium]